MSILRKIFHYPAKATDAPPTAWVDHLSSMDDISAIELSVKKLSHDFEKIAFQNTQSLKALILIDEKTHSIVESITAHFIHIENMNEELKTRISNAVFLYHRQLFIIYLNLLEHHALIQQPTLHILLSRAIRNATQMIKWRHYNYQCSPAKIWLQISEIYKIAEQHSLLNAKVQSYPDQEPISLSSAYILACMLGTLETTSLKPQQIEFVCKLLTTWTAKITIEDTYDAGQQLFYVDTASDSPAQRIRNFKPADSYRYWCFEDVNTTIELCILLMEYKISPKQTQMKALINSKYAAETLETLRNIWSKTDYKRQRRSQQRFKNAASVNIAYGFNDICNQFKQYERIRSRHSVKTHSIETHSHEELFELQLTKHRPSKNVPNIFYLKPNLSEATIVDQSDHGLGVDVIKQSQEVALTMLVSISNHDQKIGMQLGLIRSVRSLGNSQLRLGIELLSHFATCVTFKNISLASRLAHNNFAADTANTSFGELSEAFTALYIPKEHAISRQETLIVPKLYYAMSDILKGELLGQEVLIRLHRAVASDNDWTQVTFSAVIN